MRTASRCFSRCRTRPARCIATAAAAAHCPARRRPPLRSRSSAPSPVACTCTTVARSRRRGCLAAGASTVLVVPCGTGALRILAVRQGVGIAVQDDCRSPRRVGVLRAGRRQRDLLPATTALHKGARGCPVDNVRRPSPSSVTNGAGFVTDGTWPSDKPAQGPSLDTRRGWGHDVSVPRLRVFVGFLQMGTESGRTAVAVAAVSGSRHSGVSSRFDERGLWWWSRCR